MVGELDRAAAGRVDRALDHVFTLTRAGEVLSMVDDPEALASTPSRN